ncbi:MAG: trypsin-like serine protease [Anaerolineaceae bacterium]|nr:MAG: trypsin-like serine protease [Anaerolineaceae bacterium]
MFRKISILLFALVAFAVVSTVQAITWGREDLDGEYPNVASVRGIEEEANAARWSCSGSLLSVDEEKVVVLTAAHCTDGWIALIAAGQLDSVGVSFDQNNVIDGSFSDATFYVRGGVPISFPAKDAPFEKLDYGLVVFSTDAVNSLGETVADRWGQLYPVQLPPDETYLPALIKSSRPAAKDLTFTAVGYGTGEKFPIPGEETGPANPAGTNLDTFPIRYIADNLTFNAHNPQNDILRLSMNIAKDENGTCNGDSGGPIFYEDAELGQVQVSLVSGGDAPCRATNTGPAFSLEAAFDFVECGMVEGDAGDVVACVDSYFGP